MVWVLTLIFFMTVEQARADPTASTMSGPTLPAVRDGVEEARARLRDSLRAPSQVDAFRTHSEVATAFGLYFTSVKERAYRTGNIDARGIVTRCVTNGTCTNEDRVKLVKILSDVAAARGFNAAILMDNKNAKDLESAAPNPEAIQRRNFNIKGGVERTQPVQVFTLDERTLRPIIENNSLALGQEFNSNYRFFIQQSMGASLQRLRDETSYLNPHQLRDSGGAQYFAAGNAPASGRGPASGAGTPLDYNTDLHQRGVQVADRVARSIQPPVLDLDETDRRDLNPVNTAQSDANGFQAVNERISRTLEQSRNAGQANTRYTVDPAEFNRFIDGIWPTN